MIEKTDCNKKAGMKKSSAFNFIGLILMAVLCSCLIFSAAIECFADEASSGRQTCYEFLVPEQGDEKDSNGLVTLDASHTDEGYIMLEYTGTAESALVQITIPDASATYTYPLYADGYKTLPLSCGDGVYTITVFEHLMDELYSVVYIAAVDVLLNDEFRPHLYPNVYVDYTAESSSTQLGISFSEQSDSDLDYLERVYEYVIENIVYDEEKAAGDLTNYIPDLEETLETGTGICFDYASLMAAMLRSQGIATKLVFGYSGTVYHAWISVYLTEYGWCDDIIEFDGQSWKLMDPTLGANNKAESVAKYIGDGSNYTEKYWY